MRSIYKYNISTDNGIIKGPITKLLTAQVQNGGIVIWAEIDTDNPERKFQIVPIGTGWFLDPPAEKDCVLDTHTYLSTIQMAGGNLIFHVYYKELTPKPVKKTIPAVPKTAAARKEYTVESVSMINPEILKIFTN